MSQMFSLQGEQGSLGERGNDGENGAKGAKGEMGAQGSPGGRGETVRFRVTFETANWGVYNDMCYSK